MGDFKRLIIWVVGVEDLAAKAQKSKP